MNLRGKRKILVSPYLSIRFENLKSTFKSQSFKCTTYPTINGPICVVAVVVAVVVVATAVRVVWVPVVEQKIRCCVRLGLKTVTQGWNESAECWHGFAAVAVLVLDEVWLEVAPQAVVDARVLVFRTGLWRQRLRRVGVVCQKKFSLLRWNSLLCRCTFHPLRVHPYLVWNFKNVNNYGEF